MNNGGAAEKQAAEAPAPAVTNEDKPTPTAPPVDNSAVQHASEEPAAASNATGEKPKKSPSTKSMYQFAYHINQKINQIRDEHPNNIMAKHFDVSYFMDLSSELQEGFVACLQSGIDNPDSSMGCCKFSTPKFGLQQVNGASFVESAAHFCMIPPPRFCSCPFVFLFGFCFVSSKQCLSRRHAAGRL